MNPTERVTAFLGDLQNRALSHELVRGLAGLDQSVINLVMTTTMLQPERLVPDQEILKQFCQKYQVKTESLHRGLCLSAIPSLDSFVAELMLPNSVALWYLLLKVYTSGHRLSESDADRAAGIISMSNTNFYGRSILMIGLAALIGPAWYLFIPFKLVYNDGITNTARDIARQREAVVGAESLLEALREIYGREGDESLFALLCRNNGFTDKHSCPGVELAGKLFKAYRHVLSLPEYQEQFIERLSAGV